nr:aminoacyl-tRNA synthetase, class 1a, anticodon-binding [Tanacetum cinerariifolium]
WSTATLRSPELGPPAIQATIDETPYTITEDLVRIQLQLADDCGIDDLPIAEIYSGMDNLGTKSGSWDQFGSPLAVALICLSDGRQFNWSSYIFKGMVSNIGNAKKFLMYPRFLQAILSIETRIKRQYKVLKFSSILFANMRLNFDGHHMPLLTAMISQDQEGEGQSSDPNIASFSRTHETNADPFTNVEDEPLGGSFHMSPPRSTQAPHAGQTLGGAKDLITLTALSSVVSTLMQKVNTLETKLKDHKKLFKDVVGKLVKKVKAMEVKLRTSKTKMVVSDSDQEEGGKQDVDLNALLSLANADVTVDSNISPGGASDNPAASTSVPVDVHTIANVPTSSISVPVGVSNKRKTLMVEEDITVKKRTFKQIQKDRLGEQAAKRLHDEEQAQVDRQRAELQRRRQQEVLASTIQNGCFNQRKKQALAEELAKERKDRPMTQGQQRTTCLVLEEPSSKRQKSTEAPIPSLPEVPPSPVVFSPKSSSTRRKSLGRNRLTKPKSKLKELDLDTDAQTFIKVVSNEDSEDEAPRLWSALVGWEVILTPLGDINALYRIDQSTAYFTTLREIFHMVDRLDLLTLYGLVVKYYANHLVAGAGLTLSWRLYTLSNVHVLETVSGEVVYMFADVPYPLSVQLKERMLVHKLEIDKDVVGNDMTTAEQLIQFIKNQLAAAQVSFA